MIEAVSAGSEATFAYGLAVPGHSHAAQQAPDEPAEVPGEKKEPEDTVSIAGRASDGQPLSEEQQQEVAELIQNDAKVRAHEAAHLAAAGGYARGGASFDYERGPDGRTYAVAGEVQIDVSPERTPEATIRKMQAVRAAAMAPAEPSSQDRAVAGAASAAMAAAQAQLASQRRAALESSGKAMPADISAGQLVDLKA